MEAFIRGLCVEKLTEFIQTQLRPLNNGFIFNHGNLRRGSQFFNPAPESKKPRRSEVFFSIFAAGNRKHTVLRQRQKYTRSRKFAQF
jgi:hypothetical protein